MSFVSLASLSGFSGSLGTSSASLVTVLASSSGLKGVYDIGPALRAASGLPSLSAYDRASGRVALMHEDAWRSESSSTASHSGVQLQALSASSAASVPGFSNPTLCLALGGSVLFDLSLGAAHYPVYQKDNLLNTNPSFDYSQFRALATAVNGNQSVPTMFGFAFNTAGTYVFADASDVCICV